jgi:hypothetical protein
MAEFNIDDILSDFKGNSTAKKAVDALDIDSILSEFNVPEAKALPKDIKKVVITGEPHPPISGLSKESSDEFNNYKSEFKDVPRTRRLLPTTNIEESISSAFKSGKEMFSSGIEDIGAGKPYKGAGKAALGALQVVTSPASGLVEGGVATPVTDITGSKDIGSRAGFVAGAAIPVVPGGSAVVKALPKNKALSTLVESIGRENLPAVVREMKANPRLAPADLSPKVLQDTQHLFANDGPQINYLKGASDARLAGSKAAVETAYDSATGLPVNGVTKLQELKKAATDAGEKEIQPAVANARPVDINPVLEHIDNIVKPGVNKIITSESTLPSTEINKQLNQVRTMLANAKEQRTDPKALHQFQSVLRQTAQELLNSADGQARRMGNALMGVRQELVKAIDKSADGKYKPALSKFRDAKEIDDAFHEGYNGIFTNSKKLEGRPEFTEEWFKGLSDAEKEAAKEGARLQLDTTIHNTRFAARRGMEVPEADFNRKKLEVIFGKEETDKLVKTLQDERKIANTHNKIIEGSQTAMRSASKEQFALPAKTEVMKSAPAVAASEAANFFMGGYPGVATGLLAGAKTAAWGKDKVKMALAREHNARYAQYALPTEGPSRDALIAALEAQIPGPKPSLVTRGANALTRIVSP